MNIYLLVLFIFLIIWIFLIYKFKWKYRLENKKKIFFLEQLEYIVSLDSYKEQIIDLDKLYHKILLEVWYRWTFWEILKKNPSIISNVNNIWKLHKLRNKLVHDFELLKMNELKEFAFSYVNEIKKLLSNL